MTTLSTRVASSGFSRAKLVNFSYCDERVPTIEIASPIRTPGGGFEASGSAKSVEVRMSVVSSSKDLLFKVSKGDFSDGG